MRIACVAAGLMATGGLAVLLACGETTGLEVSCGDLGHDPSQPGIRLHFVNVTNTPGIQVSATFGGKTCGPADLPVMTQEGLELAQFLIPGGVGTVITATAEGAGIAVAKCRVTDLAAPSPELTEDLYQTFVDVSGSPLGLTCSNGLEVAP
jgi:hypothetical protein